MCISFWVKFHTEEKNQVSVTWTFFFCTFYTQLSQKCYMSKTVTTLDYRKFRSFRKLQKFFLQKCWLPARKSFWKEKYSKQFLGEINSKSNFFLWWRGEDDYVSFNGVKKTTQMDRCHRNTDFCYLNREHAKTGKLQLHNPVNNAKTLLACIIELRNGYKS